MKSGIKKTTVTLFAVIFAVLQLFIPAVAAPGQTVQFGGSAISAKKGDIITVPIVISSNTTIELGGLSFYLQYKGDCLSYVEGSGSACVDKMSEALVYNSLNADRVSFAWTSGEVIKLSKSTVLCKPQFRVLDTANSDSDITLNISEAYTFTEADGKVQMTELNILNNPVNIDISIDSADGHVENVKKLIDAIGRVTYTDECLEKIVAAASAYSVLTDAQKEKVTNYNVLSQAMIEYERLRIEAEESAVSNEISSFMNKHLQTLALTTDTVTLNDEKAVIDAINDFNKLSTDAQYKIYSYNTLLKNLRKRINDLKNEAAEKEAAAEEEARLRSEAQEYARIFREEKAPFLSMKVEDLVAEHYTGISDALENLSMLSEINPYVSEYLKSEKIVLTGLMDAVQDIIKNNKNNEVSSEQLEADMFKNNFSYVLSLNADTITADDALDVRLAASIYEMLDPSVQALLENEYSVISALLEKIETMDIEYETDSDEYEESDSEEGNSDSENNVIKVVQKGVGKVTMRFANREMGAVVWILLLLFILSGVIFAALQIFYHRFCKMVTGTPEELEDDSI